MGKYRRKKTNKLLPFVAMTYEILDSDAYKALPHAASKALPFFLRKVKLPYKDPDRYENDFTFSYSEGKRSGFSSSTFHKIICELVEKGFIDPVDKGGLRSDGRSYNYFKLSRRWEKYGKEDFEKMNWQTFLPKVRVKATRKNEMNSFKKGNTSYPEVEIISINEPVGAF